MIRPTTKDFAPSAPTRSPETRKALEQKLSAMGLVRGSGNLCDYEYAKQFVNGLNVDAHTRDRLIRWVVDFLRV